MEVQDPSLLLGDATIAANAASAVSKGKWHQTKKKKLNFIAVIMENNFFLPQN